jgi:hypothetical protein
MMVKKHFYELMKSGPVFLFLLPVFFVFHGFTINYDSVPVTDALLLTLEYLAVTAILSALVWFVFRDIIKTALLIAIAMSVYFFYGNILDFLKNSFPASSIWRYRVLLPWFFLLFLAVFIWLYRRKYPLYSVAFYLNILFSVFILWDGAQLLLKMPTVARAKAFHASDEGFTIYNNGNKPDIFLIIPDQYTGRSALRDVFHFDNSAFENELRRRGFYVATKSTSNYNFTPFSVASTLDMSYLSLPEGKQNYNTVNYSYSVIRNSRVLKFLSASGYNFYNCSVFDFDDHPAHKYTAFLPYGIKLITAQTFAGRLLEDFQNDVKEGKYGLTKLQRKLVYEDLRFNNRMIDLTVKMASQKAASPKFVYAHLMIPHFPHYFDSKGNLMPMNKLTVGGNSNRADYVEYLQYGNAKLLQLVDSILIKSTSPPVIILLSDHGFQHPGKDISRSYDFVNLNAVYFPGRNYNLLYDSISNVNEFRVILNSCLGQQLPLLKDSTYNLRD